MIKMLKISAFYLDKQKSFVPNAMKLCNSCNMMFVVSNYLYLYVVTPITVDFFFNYAQFLTAWQIFLDWI